MPFSVTWPLLLLLIFACQSVGQSDGTLPPTPYGVLNAEWKAELDSLKSDSAATDGNSLQDRKMEMRKKYTHRFFELAEEHPNDDLWLDCFIWIGVHGVAGRDLDAMIDLTRKRANHVENTIQLQLFMSELISIESVRLNPALFEIAENHPSMGVRGAALYALAARTKRLAQRDGSPKGCKEAERLLEKVLTDYPTVHTYRGENKDNAERLLEELRSPVALGKTAPETKGKTLDGSVFDLSQHRGKVVVLSFSGHWCGPCVAMHPVEKRLLEKYTRQQLAIIEINSDRPDDLNAVVRKIASDGLHWQLVTDGPRGPVSRSWHVTSWPTFYILDRKHRIRRRAAGNIGKQLAVWVEELLLLDDLSGQ